MKKENCQGYISPIYDDHSLTSESHKWYRQQQQQQQQQIQQQQQQTTNKQQQQRINQVKCQKMPETTRPRISPFYDDLGVFADEVLLAEDEERAGALGGHAGDTHQGRLATDGPEPSAVGSPFLVVTPQ